MGYRPRLSLRVSYLTSGCHATARAVLHFFQVTDVRPQAQKRILVLADRATYAADLDTAINRCCLVSQIEEMCMFEEHLRPLTGPLTAYDNLVQMSTMLDFVRTISAVFKPGDHGNHVPIFELDESQPIVSRVNCRPAVGMEGDDSYREHQDAMRRLKEGHQTELARLRDSLRRTKDEQLLELLDAQTQVEQLKHNLAASEALVARLTRSDGTLCALEAEHGFVPSPRQPDPDRSRPLLQESAPPPPQHRQPPAAPPSPPVLPRSPPPVAHVNIIPTPAPGGAEHRSRRWADPAPQPAARSTVSALVDQLSRELEASEVFLNELDRQRSRAGERQAEGERSPRTPRRQGRPAAESRVTPPDSRRTPSGGRRSRPPKQWR